MEFRKTALDGVVVVVPRRFGDDRGWFSEVYTPAPFADAGIEVDFVQDNESFSATPGTIRGFHYQLAPQAQTKLVRVLRGRILDIAVDIRSNSPTFGEHVAVELSADLGNQLLVPAGFAHAFCTLEPDVHLAYKVSEVYAPDTERTIRWNDPAIGVGWPEWSRLGVRGPTLSSRDQAAPLLAEQPDVF